MERTADTISGWARSKIHTPGQHHGRSTVLLMNSSDFFFVRVSSISVFTVILNPVLLFLADGPVPELSSLFT